MSKGIQNMLAASALFAIMNACVKALGREIPTLQVVFFRGFIMFLIVSVMIYKQKQSFLGTNKLYLLLRGLAGTLALSMYFYTLQRMPLASAVTIQYLSPIFAVLLAVVILKEHITKLQLLFFIVSFSGVVFIKQFDTRISLTLVGIGVLSSIISGFAYNMIRKLRHHEHPLTIIFYFSVISSFGILPFAISSWVNPDLNQWMLLVLIGILTYFAQITMTKAYQMESMKNVAGIRYLGVLYALILGFFLFGEFFDWRALLGMILVTLGILGNIWHRSRYS